MNALQKRQRRELDTLLSTRRWCFVVPVEAFVEGYGFRASLAIEKESGHRPTGDLDVLSDDPAIVRAAYERGASAPYFWGMTYAEAEAACKEQNARLGFTELEAALIVASTMAGPGKRTKRSHE